MIIGLCGKKRSGKDTIADFLEILFEESGIKTVKLSFAAALKDLIKMSLDLTDHDDNFLKNAEFYPAKSKLGNFLLNINQYMEKYKLSLLTEDEINVIKILYDLPVKFAYRKLLQYIGTDIVRKRYVDFWIDRIKERIDETNADIIIIPDVRFPNEAEFIKSFNGIIVKLIHYNESKVEDFHESEKMVDLIEPDLIYSPKFGLKYLFEVARDIVTEIAYS